MENGNALVPDECIIGIDTNISHDTIYNSSVCKLTLPENSSVSLSCSNMEGFVAEAQKVVTSDTTFIFVKTNCASLGAIKETPEDAPIEVKAYVRKKARTGIELPADTPVVDIYDESVIDKCPRCSSRDIESCMIGNTIKV